MKHLYLVLFSALILFVATSSVSIKSSAGIAGYTGAPGGFGTCGNQGCHAGGSSATSGLTITAVPSFSNNEYKPDSIYQVSIQTSATGFNRYGFDCEILTTAGANAGVISANLAAGVKTLQAGGGRRDAVHTAPRFGTGGTTFTFPWKAPSSGTVVVYATTNAVNGNGSTSGDFPLAPVSLSLSPYVAPVDTTTTSLHEKGKALSADLKVYPNPATVFTSVNYYLSTSAPLRFVITDIKGKVVHRSSDMLVQAGENTQSLDLRTLTPGAYFVRVESGGTRLGQKLLLIN